MPGRRTFPLPFVDASLGSKADWNGSNLAVWIGTFLLRATNSKCSHVWREFQKAVGGSWKRSMWGWSDDISYRCWIFTRNAPNGECARQWRMNIGMCMWAEVLTEIPGKDLRDLWLSWVRPYLQQVAVVVAQTINHTWQRLHSPTQFDGFTILEGFPSSSVEKMKKLRTVNWTSSPLRGNLLKGFPWNLPDQPPKWGPDAEGSDQGDGSSCRGG